MPRLRDYFAGDLENMINIDEFAEICKVDGKDMPIVKDNDLLQEKKLKHGGEGLFRGEVLFHVSKTEFETKPIADRMMRLDGAIYSIVDVAEEEGMYTITLERYRS